MSNGAKVAIIFGTIAAIVGGILLHKHNSTKAVEQVSEQAGNTIKQTTKELTQAVKDLVSQGRISQKEAEMFNQIHDLEGEEFVKKAYELIAKDMNLEKVPNLVVSFKNENSRLGHMGKDITIYIKEYEKAYGKEQAKEEILNTIRHELEHYKQDLIVFLEKGEQEFQEAHYQHIARYIGNKAALKGGNSKDLNAVIKEEAERVGSSVRCSCDDQNELYRMIYEHDSPITTIRKMVPCDFEKLNLTQEEKVKADEYLEGIRTYMRDCFPDNFFVNGELNENALVGNKLATSLVSLYIDTGYYHNPIEEGARQAGEALKEKFKVFVEAMK